MAQRISNHRRLFAVAAPLLMSAALLGACSKSNDQNTSSGNATTTAGGSGTSTTSGGGGGGSGTTTKGTSNAATNLDTKVWYQGFRYDLGEVSLDKGKGILSIKTKVTNLGPETSTPYPPMQLVNGGVEVAHGGLQQSPSITGGKSADASAEFGVPDDFSLSGTTLVFSNGSEYVEAKVPLDGKGDKVTLEPIEQVQVPDPLTIGTVTVTPKVAQVRWDIPGDHSLIADAGKAFVLITGTAQNSGTNTAYFNSTGITLTTDSGTYPVVFTADNSIPPTQTTDKFGFYFQVKEPVDGTWTMEFKDQPFGPDSANVTASEKVTLSEEKKATTGTTR